MPPHPQPTMPIFAVDRFDVGACACVLILRGELDLDTAPALNSALHALRADGYRRLVLDVSPLQFIDSTGLGVLIDFQRTLGQRLAVAEPQAFVSALLEVAGLADTFDLFSRVDDALTHVGVPNQV